MPLITGWATNKGIVREDNQDCCYVEVFENAMTSAVIAVMCDGMGGLSEGSVASRTVCEAAKKWFDSVFHSGKQTVLLSPKEIVGQLTRILEESNDRLVDYGRKKRIQVGTTASILFLFNGTYHVIHIGDSRIYRLSADCRQLTEDDCVAAEKLRRGKISRDEYERSREKHILTQCVGVNRKLDVHIYTGRSEAGDVFFLCSDGMYHNMQPDEIASLLLAQRREKGTQSTLSIERTIDKMISRGEKDNLTGIIVCVC